MGQKSKALFLSRTHGSAHGVSNLSRSCLLVRVGTLAHTWVARKCRSFAGQRQKFIFIPVAFVRLGSAHTLDGI